MNDTGGAMAAVNDRFRGLVDESGYSLQEVAEGADVPFETVRNLYYGKVTDPKVSTVEKLSAFFHISMNCFVGKCQYTPAEKTLLRNYQQCGKRGKSIIELIAKYEAGAVKSEREAIGKHKIPCLVPHGDISKGIVYDSCENAEVETSAPEAYFAIQMVNNYLAPIYCKDDYILLENRFPENNEYAAFLRGDRVYIRKFIEEEKQYRLKCLHNQGEDIVLKRMDEIEYIGTCVGAIRS